MVFIPIKMGKYITSRNMVMNWGDLMIISELTTSDVTKLITILSEEIAVLGIRMKAYPDKTEEYQRLIKINERIIEKLEKMF